MARAHFRPNELRTADYESDEVERSLDVLDKVLLEFEDDQELSPEVLPKSPTQGHQSEDDGYMSLNGKRTQKFVPDFQPTEEVAHPSDSSFSPPTPEEANRIISHLLPRISPSTIQETVPVSRKPFLDFNIGDNSMFTSNSSFGIKLANTNSLANDESQASSAMSSLDSTSQPLQTTLPKARPASATPSRFGSLPSANPTKILEEDESFHENVYIGRNFISIGISAVQDVASKGGARAIANEPQTYTPSPIKRVPPRTLAGSIERHREVRRKNPVIEPVEEPVNFILQQNDFKQRPRSPVTQFGVKISIQAMDEMMNNRDKQQINEKKMNLQNKRHSQHNRKKEQSDEDRFSDDSLEGSSLPPAPAPVPPVPPPPSLSAPNTPSKRHSIAWEVNLDDLTTNGNGIISSKMLENSKADSVSESSICSTTDQSSEASNKMSSDWPDPPDIPICSTEEDEGSYYSDSDLGDGRGTFVIRKGRRRQRIEMETLSSHISQDGQFSIGSNFVLGLPSPIYPPSMMPPVESFPAPETQEEYPDEYPEYQEVLQIEEPGDLELELNRSAPLKEIESNIDSLLQGEVVMVRVAKDNRVLEVCPGSQKFELPKDMSFTEPFFGPLPDSPSPELDEFPPLPPSPGPEDFLRGIHNISRGGPSLGSLKTRSMDANFSQSYRYSPQSPGTLPDLPTNSSRRRVTCGFPKRAAQSPQQERRLPNSCSLPETPIYAKGCDIPRIPQRFSTGLPVSSARQPGMRPNVLHSSIQEIGSYPQGGHFLQLNGLPARGWYPKQRQARMAASTEHLEKSHHGSLRFWENDTRGGRKPLTLPPNSVPPKFPSKSPKGLRRVTSLLFRKKDPNQASPDSKCRFWGFFRKQKKLPQSSLD